MIVTTCIKVSTKFHVHNSLVIANVGSVVLVSWCAIFQRFNSQNYLKSSLTLRFVKRKGTILFHIGKISFKNISPLSFVFFLKTSKSAIEPNVGSIAS